MKNLEKLARTFRLPETTTPENLACNWSTTLNFGNKVILAGYYSRTATSLRSTLTRTATFPARARSG